MLQLVVSTTHINLNHITTNQMEIQFFTKSRATNALCIRSAGINCCKVNSYSSEGKLCFKRQTCQTHWRAENLPALEDYWKPVVGLTMVQVSVASSFSFISHNVIDCQSFRPWHLYTHSINEQDLEYSGNNSRSSGLHRKNNLSWWSSGLQ